MRTKRFTKISETAFNELQMDAGVLLKTFDPSNPTMTLSNIVCATTGGITASCVPTYQDNGEDVDNCPNNMKEFKEITGYDAKMSFTALNVTADVIKLSLGAADITQATGKITPRNHLELTDFTDAIWWVGDLSDGGFAAICLKNALSTSGLSLKTTKGGKGNLTVELTGHYSISAQDEVPMDFYVSEGTESSAPVVPG